MTHSRAEYVRYEDGEAVHTNSAEGYFSIFKRGMRGIYQHCGEKHLHRYLAEYDLDTTTEPHSVSMMGNVRRLRSKVLTASVSRTGRLTQFDFKAGAARFLRRWKKQRRRFSEADD